MLSLVCKRHRTPIPVLLGLVTHPFSHATSLTRTPLDAHLIHDGNDAHALYLECQPFGSVTRNRSNYRAVGTVSCHPTFFFLVGNGGSILGEAKNPLIARPEQQACTKHTGAVVVKT